LHLCFEMFIVVLADNVIFTNLPVFKFKIHLYENIAFMMFEMCNICIYLGFGKKWKFNQ